MRGFIFSLDAFVAFTLALIAIYSLIFFSSIPSSYYYLLTQAHYLTKDVLISLSSTPCAQNSCNGITLLDDIASTDTSNTNSRYAVAKEIENVIGLGIPPQYGYAVQLSEDNGKTWTPLYDTSISYDPNSPASAAKDETHAQGSRKLSVSSEVVTFGSSKNNLPQQSTYYYNTCGGQNQGGLGLLTCSAQGSGINNPDNLGDNGAVPPLNARIIKLTVFI